MRGVIGFNVDEQGHVRDPAEKRRWLVRMHARVEELWPTLPEKGARADEERHYAEFVATRPPRFGPAPRTHCGRGHLFDEDNIYRPPGRPREHHCRICAHEYSARRARAMKVARHARRVPGRTWTGDRTL